MIQLEIDGKKFHADPGMTIIQVADKAGIYIPRFCYHEKLTVAASCRMCLVEVEKSPKSLPACATPVTPDMKVFTRSEKALFSQKTVMEFLLVNHPLDCPICDQGGECELQDLSMGYGAGLSRFTEGKRTIKDKNLGPLISSEMTRCIQCTRCVRFGDEVAGMRELGAVSRGEELEISTYVQRAVQSELSGNMIDVCPVGALTSKPYRFTARAWEMSQHPAIAPHDCLGSHIYLHTRGEEFSDARRVMRVVPRENESINEVWLSDRDRYSYEGIYSEDRVLKPLAKQSVLTEIDWAMALSGCVARLKEIIDQHGEEQIGALISPNATLEECFLFQKLLRSLGIHNIDHRIRQTDFSGPTAVPLYPCLDFSIAELENLDTVLLIGSNLRYEQPLANHRIRKAFKKGASIMSLNPVDYDFNVTLAEKSIKAGDAFVLSLAEILKVLCEGTQENISPEILKELEPIQPSQASIAMAEKLKAGKNPALVIGAYALNHPDAYLVRSLSTWIGKLISAKIACFTEGPNTAGAWLAGAVSDGLNAREMFKQPRKAYILFGLEPEYDVAYPEIALTALKNADFVVSFSAFRNKIMDQYAHLILPIATFAETAGTFVNVEGKWQTSQAATVPMEECRPGWKVLSILGKLFKLSGFDYSSSDEIKEELLNTSVPKPRVAVSNTWVTRLQKLNTHYQAEKTVTRITEWPMYQEDGLVRRAKSLQAVAAQNSLGTIRINSELAKRLDLKTGMTVTAIQGSSQVTLPLVVDSKIAEDAVYIPAGLEVTAGFGESGANITISLPP